MSQSMWQWAGLALATAATGLLLASLFVQRAERGGATRIEGWGMLAFAAFCAVKAVDAAAEGVSLSLVTYAIAAVAIGTVAIRKLLPW